MLNREKYAKEILDIVCDGDSVAIVNGKPVHCIDTTCYICEYNCSCDEEFKKWANSEYIEPSVDWSKVAIDTPILVRESKSDKWKNKYFAMYRDGRIYTWIGGATSWSVESIKNNTGFMTSWKYAKLTEE